MAFGPPCHAAALQQRELLAELKKIFIAKKSISAQSTKDFCRKTDLMLFAVYVRSLLTKVAKPIFQLVLLAIFLYFFGLPAIEKYLKKEVIMVEEKRDSDGIPFPAITIAAVGQQKPKHCYKLDDGTAIERCITNNSPNSSDLLKGIMLGFVLWEDQQYLHQPTFLFISLAISTALDLITKLISSPNYFFLFKFYFWKFIWWIFAPQGQEETRLGIIFLPSSSLTGGRAPCSSAGLGP